MVKREEVKVGLAGYGGTSGGSRDVRHPVTSTHARWWECQDILRDPCRGGKSVSEWLRGRESHAQRLNLKRSSTTVSVSSQFKLRLIHRGTDALVLLPSCWTCSKSARESSNESTRSTSAKCFELPSEERKRRLHFSPIFTHLY